jgi:hypothetical protein
MSNPNSQAILDHLWPASHQRWMKVCAVLDGARDPRVFRAVDISSRDKFCLYAGRLPFAIQEVAPQLVLLERDDKLTHLLLEEGWGKSWGIFLRTESPLSVLRRHLRTFLRVKDERGRKLLFRWYDPRVMRVYLPTCLPEELRLVYGPVDHYYMEGADPTQLLDFRFENGRLRQTPIDLTQH